MAMTYITFSMNPGLSFTKKFGFNYLFNFQNLIRKVYNVYNLEYRNNGQTISSIVNAFINISSYRFWLNVVL